VGYEAGDMEVILDMGKPTAVRRILMRFVSSPNSWIFLPRPSKWVPRIRWAVCLGSKRSEWRPERRLCDPEVCDTLEERRGPVSEDKGEELREVPGLAQLAGRAAWIFVDEIFVE